MRRAMMICLLLVSVAALGASQETAGTTTEKLTNGELASLILKTGQPQAAQLSPAAALREVQDLGLMPNNWRSDAVVTQEAFADVMAEFGIHYLVTSNAAPVSDSVAQTYLRRDSNRVHDTVMRPTDRLLSQQNVLDQGRPRFVSQAVPD